MKFEDKFLTDLAKKKQGIYLYMIPKIYRISAGQLYVFIKKNKTYIEIKEDKIYLNKLGKKFILTKKKILNENNDIYRNIPTIFLDKKIAINEFYIPESFKR